MVFGFMHSLIFKTCGKMEMNTWEDEERDGVLDKAREQRTA